MNDVEKKLHMGRKIKELRNKHNMTQKQVGELLHVTDKAVSKWETGQGYPDMAMIPLLADIFNISPSVLFNENDNTEEVKEVVNTTLDYAKNVEKTKRQLLISKVAIIITVTFAIGLLVCLVVDISMNARITWAVYPVTSIVFVWVLAIIALLTKRNKFAKTLIAFTICLLPFVWIIERTTNFIGWFRQMAVPISIVALVMAWILFFCRKSRIEKRIRQKILNAGKIRTGAKLSEMNITWRCKSKYHQKVRYGKLSYISPFAVVFAVKIM